MGDAILESHDQLNTNHYICSIIVVLLDTSVKSICFQKPSLLHNASTIGGRIKIKIKQQQWVHPNFSQI